jgi:hypothetical protein
MVLNNTITTKDAKREHTPTAITNGVSIRVTETNARRIAGVDYNKEKIMNFFNNRFLSVMKKTIKKLRNDKRTKVTFTTVQLIMAYVGSYQIDKTSAHDSINANIGKFLKENAKALGIQEKKPKKSITIRGKRTSTSVWEYL